MALQETDIVTEAFHQRFGSPDQIRIFRAPGRVNLIGEHTDYNFGFVLPIAMEMACFSAAALSSEARLKIYSKNVDETVEWALHEIPELHPAGHWSDYPLGVAKQLLQLGFEILPLNIAVYSTVPVGSGLSSSAAIEVSCAQALLFGRVLDRLEIAKLAQRAEREFVGVPCGIMDQYVSVFGETGKAIRLDCRSVTHETVALPRNLTILAVNSMVKHELGSSEYSVRVRECAEAVEAVRRVHPAVKSLRDVSTEMLDTLEGSMPDVVFRRARHVTSEDERVLQFTAAAAASDLLAMGRLFLASHRSLQHDYEVSAEELDFLVDTASDFSGVYGARMTGGGFGGCTVNLISPERAEQFRTHITAAYQRRYQLVPQIYDCIPSSGAGEIPSPA